MQRTRRIVETSWRGSTSVLLPAEVDTMLDELQTGSLEVLALTLAWARKPGEWLWQWLDKYSPVTADWLSGGADEPGAVVLAEQLRRRPAQVQRSLDKLHDQRLVDPLLGSTDGYGNYRLTDSGAWYMAAYRRAGSTGNHPPP